MRLLWARSMTQPAPETIRTPKTRIACDGTGDGLADAALGHPRVWLEIDPDAGFADSWPYGTSAEEILADLEERI